MKICIKVEKKKKSVAKIIRKFVRQKIHKTNSVTTNMGKITGFLEFTRELPEKRPTEERLNDYYEFIKRYSDEKLNQQSARCMDCGVPFCQDGCPLRQCNSRI